MSCERTLSHVSLISFDNPGSGCDEWWGRRRTGSRKLYKYRKCFAMWFLLNTKFEFFNRTTDDGICCCINEKKTFLWILWNCNLPILNDSRAVVNAAIANTTYSYPIMCISFSILPGGWSATLAQSDADMEFDRRIIRKLYTNIQFIKKFW